MITLHKRDLHDGEIPDMTRAELDREWHQVKAAFDLALAHKTEADRTYVAAATRLNMLERIVKKVEQRAAVDKRAAAKAQFLFGRA